MFRLINLSLALAAVIGAVLTPVRLISGLIVSAPAARTLSPFVNFLVETSLNFLVPATAFLLILCAFGLHKKARAKKPKSPFSVTFSWILYFGAWFLILNQNMLSDNTKVGLGYGFSLILWPVVIIIVLVLIGSVGIGISKELGNFASADTSQANVGIPLINVVSVAFFWMLVTAGILWLSPGKPIHATTIHQKQHEELCKDVGEQFFGKPSTPVKSIAYVWKDKVYSDIKCYVVRRDGSFRYDRSPSNFGCPYVAAIRYKAWLKQTKLFEDVHKFGAVTENKNGHSMKQDFIQFDADAIVFREVSNPVETRKNIAAQPSTKHTLTVFDSSTGNIYAKMRYAIDHKNRQACGINLSGKFGAYIDEYSFIHKALTSSTQ